MIRLLLIFIISFPVYAEETSLYNKVQKRLYDRLNIKSKIKNKRVQHQVKVSVIDTGISSKVSNIITGKTKNRERSSIISFSREQDHGTHVQGIIHLLNKDAIISHYNFYKTYSYKKNNKYLLKYIKKSIDSGNKIINLSLNGREPIKEEFDLIKYGEGKGVIFIVSSGNNKLDLDYIKRSYPALYNLKNVISVANYEDKDNMHWTSNYGKDSIFIGTSGTRIPSFCVTFSSCYMTGSSQSTPIITSAVSLMLERYPFLTTEEIKYILKINSISDKNTESGYFSYSSFINWMNKEYNLISMKFLRKNLNMFYSKTKINWNSINKEKEYYQVPFSYRMNSL